MLIVYGAKLSSNFRYVFDSYMRLSLLTSIPPQHAHLLHPIAYYGVDYCIPAAKAQE